MNTQQISLLDNWVTRRTEIREGRFTEPLFGAKVSWANGTKHGLEEGSRSSDILIFLSRQTNRSSTVEALLQSLPTIFPENHKTPRQNAIDYLRELAKMGIINRL